MDHDVAAHILDSATYGARESHMIDTLNDLKRGMPDSDHYIARKFDVRDSIDDWDKRAVAAHSDRNYKRAAELLDVGTSGLEWARQQLRNAHGRNDHPTVQTYNKYIENRREMTNAYRKTLGLTSRLDDAFDKITGNLSQQFGDH